MRGVATVVVLAILVAVVVGASLVVHYLNSQKAMSGDLIKAIAAIDYSSYSGGYGHKTTVDIGGVTAHVNWDEKALAVIGYGGERFSIYGVVTYWHTFNYGMATKSNIPWGFWSATCYRAGITWHDHHETVVQTSYTKIKMSVSAWNSLGPGLKNLLTKYKSNVGGGIVLNIPVTLYHLYALADVKFENAQRPWFGSCNNWQLYRLDTLLIDKDLANVS